MTKKLKRDLGVNQVQKWMKNKTFPLPKSENVSHAFKKTPPQHPIPHMEKSGKPVGNAKIMPQKPPKVALEQLHCTANQSYPLFFLEKAAALYSRKIQSMNVKERFMATRRLKKLSHEMQQWIHAKVTQDVKVIGDEPIEFYNLLEKREERHFQIDRIIKYLSD